MIEFRATRLHACARNAVERNEFKRSNEPRNRFLLFLRPAPLLFRDHFSFVSKCAASLRAKRAAGRCQRPEHARIAAVCDPSAKRARAQARFRTVRRCAPVLIANDRSDPSRSPGTLAAREYGIMTEELSQGQNRTFSSGRCKLSARRSLCARYSTLSS